MGIAVVLATIRRSEPLLDRLERTVSSVKHAENVA